LTKRCSKLVNDQFSILFDKTIRRHANRALTVTSLLDIRFLLLIPTLRPGAAPAPTAHVVRISAAVQAMIFNRERWVCRTPTL
jgi:hypothetical protein